MKEYLLKLAFCICYVISAVFLAVFAASAIISWLTRQKLLSNPFALVAPYSFMLIQYAVIFLVPAAVFGVLGFVIHRISKKS